MLCNQNEQMDKLTGALIGLARATDGNDYLVTDSTADAIVAGLSALNPDNDTLLRLLEQLDTEKRKLVPMCYECLSSCGRNNNYDMQNLRKVHEDVRSLKTLILLGCRIIAVRIRRAAELGRRDDATHNFLYKALFAVGMDDWGTEELLPIVLEVGEVNRNCVAMLNGEDPAIQSEWPNICISTNVLNLLAEKLHTAPEAVITTIFA